MIEKSVEQYFFRLARLRIFKQKGIASHSHGVREGHDLVSRPHCSRELSADFGYGNVDQHPFERHRKQQSCNGKALVDNTCRQKGHRGLTPPRRSFLIAPSQSRRRDPCCARLAPAEYAVRSVRPAIVSVPG